MVNHRYFNILILPIILFIMCYLAFGYYFETNDDFVISALLKGDLQPQGGYYELSNLFLFKIAFIYHILYVYIPKLPWYGITLLILNLAACINIFYITDKLISKYFHKYFNTIIFICVFIIIFFENVIEINYTRTSIILGGSSLLLIFFNLSSEGNLKINKYIIIQFALFIFALLIRPMGGLLSSLILIPVIIFFIIKSNNSRKLFYYLASIYFIILILYSYTQYFKPADEKHYLDNLLKVANFMDWGIDKEVKNNNVQDSIKKQAAKNLFISDKQIINSEFLDKISSSNYFSYDKINISRIKSAVISTFQLSEKNYPGICLFYLITLGLLFYTNFKINKSSFWFVLIIQFIFFILFISISVFMKLPDRIFYPLSTIIITCNFILLSYSNLNFIKNKKIFISILILAVSVIFSFISMEKRYSALNNLNIENKECFSTLEREYKNTIFLITQPSYILFDGNGSLENLHLENNKTFPLIGWNTILPSYALEIKEMCKSSNINDFFNFLKNNNDFILISNTKFNLFLEIYFKTFYNNEIKFTQEPESPEILKKRDLYLYKIATY